MLSVLDHFSTLLLDMNSTFMFDEDRFGSGYDYAATYRNLGGQYLSESLVRNIIQDCFKHLNLLYRDSTYQDCFPTVREMLNTLPQTRDFNDTEINLLEKTFAVHECGRIPVEYASALKRLSDSHRLGLVADIWSEKELWVSELNRAGVSELFDVLVFSSETGSVKPSPKPFLEAIRKMETKPEDCLVIGDSERRDVAGAKAAGLPVVLINKDKPAGKADWVVGDLLDLVS